MLRKKLKMLDLFSGIGGFSLAANKDGFETIGFCEKDLFCQKILRKHWPIIPIFDDIKKLHWDKSIDLITGGFPCQSFSIAGKKKGINDDRYLWPEFFRIIRESKPTWIIAENVVGIVEMELDNILDDLESEGYKTQTFNIPACAANAPHRRERIWIVANRDCERRNLWTSDWSGRHFQNNQKWNISPLQQEWAQFKPKSWEARKVSHWMSFNTESLRRDDGLPERLDKDRVKALGNSIVPQVVFPILASIVLIENKLMEIPK